MTISAQDPGPPPDLGELPLGLGTDVIVWDAVTGDDAVIDIGRSILGNGSDGELRVPWSAELVRDQDIEIASEPIGDDCGNRDTAARHPENQGPIIGADDLRQRRGQLLTRIDAIAVHR